MSDVSASSTGTPRIAVRVPGDWGGLRRSFLGELWKLWKRPATRLVMLFLIVNVLFIGTGYIYNYLTYLTIVVGKGQPNVTPGNTLAIIMPGSLVPTVLDTLGYWDYAVGIVFGALVAGGEYGWGSIKTVVTQRPSRLSAYTGKVLAMWVVLAVMIAVVFIVAAITSIIFKHVLAVQLQAMLGPNGAELVAPGLSGGNQQAFQMQLGNTMKWPPVWEVVRGIGAEWLIMGVYSMIGFLAATLFRSTTIGIAIGFGWWIAQSIPDTLAVSFDSMHRLASHLPGALTSVLATAFGLPGSGGLAQAQGEVVVDAGVAAGTMAIYIVILAIVGGIVFRLRDVK